MNLEEARVRVYEMLPEFNVRLQIVQDNGRTPELTDYWKRLLSQEKAFRIRNAVELKKGEMVTQTIDLKDIYVLQPGQYGVTIFRTVMVSGKNREVQGKTLMTVP